MEFSGDELAGVVDLFGGLTRAELGTALAELAYKRGHAYDPEGFTPEIRAATERYHLVALDATVGDPDEPVLVPGPGAFPTLPDGAADLEHILDIDSREIGRETAKRGALDRFRRDAATAVQSGEPERIDRLFDVSYELEAWVDVDLSAERAHLESVR